MMNDQLYDPSDYNLIRLKNHQNNRVEDAGDVELGGLELVLGYRMLRLDDLEED